MFNASLAAVRSGKHVEYFGGDSTVTLAAGEDEDEEEDDEGEEVDEQDEGGEEAEEEGEEEGEVAGNAIHPSSRWEHRTQACGLGWSRIIPSHRLLPRRWQHSHVVRTYGAVAW